MISEKSFVTSSRIIVCLNLYARVCLDISLLPILLVLWNELLLLQLLCGLLNWACVSSVAVTGVDRLLTTEVEWLKTVRSSVAQLAQGSPEPPVDETLLEGHLCVTRELVAFLPPEKKYEIGGDPGKSIFLIRVSIITVCMK